MSFTLYPLKRLIIAVTGADVRQFLQGLLTQDLQKVSPTRPLYSLLLTPQGKFLYDFFVFQSSDDLEGIFMDCAYEDAPSLVEVFKRYQLRANVQWQLLENIKVYVVLNEENAMEKPVVQGPTMALFQDPRQANLGWRVYGPSSLGQKVESGCAQIQTGLSYREMLMKQGIPESGWGLIQNKSVPLECGMMELEAIDWQKGCYLGQELTARTRYRGVIRKRLLPGRLLSDLTHDIEQGDLLYYKEDCVGKVVAICNQSLLCLVRLEALPSDFQAKSFDLYKTLQTTSASEEPVDLKLKNHKSIGQVSITQPSWINLPLLNLT